MQVTNKSKRARTVEYSVSIFDRKRHARLSRFAKRFINVYKVDPLIGNCDFTDLSDNKAACTLLTAAGGKLVSERRV